MDVITAATGLFQSYLHAGPNPGAAYLAGTADRRLVPQHLQLGAGLGYAPHGYVANLTALGFSAEDIQQAGLTDDQHREVYGDRLTFPWTDMAGQHVIGLGGRAVTPRRPKYVNTPDPLFAKGRALFGIAQASAAMHHSGWAIVVEGPFDAIALWELGWANAVATVGAKVTADQLAMVLRLVDQVVVLLDADEGGRRGRAALEDMLRRQPWPPAATVYAATLTETKDPGDPATTALQVYDALVAGTPLHI